jgi:hypothetical protein
VRLVEALGGDHPLARVETDGALTVRACPGERDAEELFPEAAPARVGPEVHPLQLDHAIAEIAQRDRADHLALVLRDPQRCIGRLRVVEVAVECGIELEPELRQRVGDERAEAVSVTRLERDD